MKTINFILFIFLFPFVTPAISQQTNALVNEIANKVSKGELTINQVLSDSFLVSLHSLTSFREMIRTNAKAGKLTIIASNEPGTRIHVKDRL